MPHSLIEASEAHLADCRFRNLSPRTIELYEHVHRAFLTDLRAQGSALRITDLNAGNVRGWAERYRELAGSDVRPQAKRGGAAMVRTAVGILKTWSRWLEDNDWLEVDTLRKVARPKSVTTARKAYEPWEIQALRGVFAERPTALRDTAMLSLLLDTGMRVGELMALHLVDVDLEARRVRVFGKGRRERVLPFGSPGERDGGKTTRRLKAYLAARHVNPRVLAADREALWLTYDGFPMTKGAFQSQWRKAARAAGLTHTEVHATRHTFATRYLVARRLAQSAIDELRYLLGHISDDTYRIYIGQAGQLLADMTGERGSISDALELAS